MYLKQIQLRNLRGFTDLRFDLSRPGGKYAGWTVFTGDNGSGKSTLLDVLCLALFGKTPRVSEAGALRVPVAGGGAGLLLGVWGMGVAYALVPDLPPMAFRLEGPVLGVSLALTLATALLSELGVGYVLARALLALRAQSFEQRDILGDGTRHHLLPARVVGADRVRMQRHSLDEGVFIRSLATRGYFGGLTQSTRSAIDVLDAVKFAKDGKL